MDKNVIVDRHSNIELIQKNDDFSIDLSVNNERVNIKFKSDLEQDIGWLELNHLKKNLNNLPDQIQVQIKEPVYD